MRCRSDSPARAGSVLQRGDEGTDTVDFAAAVVDVQRTSDCVAHGVCGRRAPVARTNRSTGRPLP